MTRPAHFPHLPTITEAPGFLYAFEMDNGLIKVGRTFYPRGRMAAHKRDLHKRGRRIVRCHAYPAQMQGDRPEIELLARMRRIANPHAATHEYFSGISYAATLNLIRQISVREFISLRPDGSEFEPL